MRAKQLRKKPNLTQAASKQWVASWGSSAPNSEMTVANFEPDILVGPEFLATFQRTVPIEPEKNLMLAVLQDALVCFQDCIGATDRRRQRLFLDAGAWFMSRDIGYVFSFENVCESLAFDPAYLRRGIQRWQENYLALRAGERLAS